MRSAQIPAAHRKDMLVRCDGAGASHKLLEWLTEQGKIRGRRVEYSVGYAITDTIRGAIKLVPKHVWKPATDADGTIREGGDVAELTGLLDLSWWPDGMRIIVRREPPHPGAQLSLFEETDGWRYQAIATNTPPSRACNWPSWKPGTAPTPGSRTGSVTPKTPAWAGSRPVSSPSTRPG